MSFVVQPILHLDVSNLLSFSCFSFCSLSKSFSKRETFFFSSPQKFTFLENFFQMQRYEILITFTYKTNFFFRKTQKKLFFPSPTPSFVHCPPCFLMVESLVAFDYPESLILMFMNVLELDERQTDDRLGFIHCCSIFVLADESWPLPSRHSLLSPPSPSPSPSPSCLSPPLLSKRNNNILFLSLIEIKEITK